MRRDGREGMKKRKGGGVGRGRRGKVGEGEKAEEVMGGRERK